LKEKEKILNKIKKNINQAKKLFDNKLDRFMLLVEKENPGFYKEFKQERETQLLSKLKDKVLKEKFVSSEDITIEGNMAKKDESNFRRKTSQKAKKANKVEA